jgi:hypothetical protein
MNVIENVDAQLNAILTDYVKKPTLIRGLLHLLLVLYAARLAPTPPKAVLQLFDNVYFKLAIFSLVLWTAQFSPATAILIALAFLVTVNYTTTGKLWEMMDNIGSEVQEPVSTETALEAVKVLADAALSEEATSPAVIAPIAEIAISAVTTEEGKEAVKALAEQAVTPEAGTDVNVTNAVNVAAEAILPPTEPIVVTVTPAQAVEAVKALGEAAASENPIPVEDVAPVVQMALSAATTEEGAASIKALGEQAITAEAGVPSKVDAAIQVAIESIVAPVAAPVAAPVEVETAKAPESGCYPLRKYDMSKVSPQGGKSEDYQPFTVTVEK